MGVLVSDVVDAVLAAVDSEVGPQLVAGWISERYRELTNKARFKHLLRFGELTLPASLDTGLVTVTAGDPVVVGDADARAEWGALGNAVVGRYIRVAGQRNWFRIAGLTGSGDLRLESPYVLPFSTAEDPLQDAAYLLIARVHRLATDARHVAMLIHPRLDKPMDEISHQEMDMAMTDRILVADLPCFWAEAGSDADGTKLVDIHPPVRNPQLIRYSYYAISPQLTLESVLPNEIDLHMLKSGALIDAYRWEMMQAAKRNQAEIAATIRNEMNTQITRWQETIREAVRTDQAGDTLSLHMNTSGFPNQPGRTVRNARDYLYVRGNRP